MQIKMAKQSSRKINSSVIAIQASSMNEWIIRCLFLDASSFIIDDYD